MGWFKEFIKNWKLGNNVRKQFGQSRWEWYCEWLFRRKFFQGYMNLPPEIQNQIKILVHKINPEESEDVTQKVDTAAKITEMKKMKIKWD